MLLRIFTVILLPIKGRLNLKSRVPFLSLKLIEGQLDGKVLGQLSTIKILLASHLAKLSGANPGLPLNTTAFILDFRKAILRDLCLLHRCFTPELFKSYMTVLDEFVYSVMPSPGLDHRIFKAHISLLALDNQLDGLVGLMNSLMCSNVFNNYPSKLYEYLMAASFPPILMVLFRDTGIVPDEANVTIVFLCFYNEF